MNWDYARGEHTPDWIRSKRPPERDMLHGDRLYHVESGCELPFDYKQDGNKWYRIQCSYWFGDWIEANGGEGRWETYGGYHRAIYMVREDLMAFIKMRWL